MAAIEFPPVTVMLADGTSLVADIWPADLYHLEEYANVSLAGLGSNISFRQLLPLAWFSLRRSQQIPMELALDDFVNKIKSFDIAEAASPKSLEPTPSTG